MKFYSKSNNLHFLAEHSNLLYINASVGNVESTSISIYNKLYDDVSSLTKLNNYTALYQNGATLSYDSTERAYKLTGNATGFTTWKINNLTVPQNCKLSMDVKGVVQSNSNNHQPRIGILNSNNTGYACVIVFDSTHKALNINPVTETGDINGIGTTKYYKVQSNIYYRLECIVENSIITANLYLDNVLVASNTHTNSTITTNNNQVIIQCHTSSGYTFFKNISVESL